MSIILNRKRPPILSPSKQINKPGFFYSQPFKKFKQKYSLDVAYIYITASYNNTLLTLTDFQGNVIKAESCGTSGFKGRFKKKFIASKKAAEKIISFCKFQRIKRVIFKLQGYRKGSEMVIRSFREKGMKIVNIIVRDKKAFNGCREKKREENNSIINQKLCF